MFRKIDNRKSSDANVAIRNHMKRNFGVKTLVTANNGGSDSEYDEKYSLVDDIFSNIENKEHLQQKFKESGNKLSNGTSGSGVSLPPWGVKVEIPGYDFENEWCDDEDIDPLDVAQLSFNDINLVPLRVKAEPSRIWDFCVAYCATAMGRLADPTRTIDISSTTTPQPVGLFWLAAVAIFYNIYECSIGQIPILQMVSSEFKDLMNALSPCNRDNKAFIVQWEADVLTIINGLGYASHMNPLITLSPVGSSFSSFGTPTVESTPPILSLDVIHTFGPEAFEEVQRYFLFNLDMTLIPYTTEGPYTNNASMFAIERDPTQTSPIDGVHQVFNEVNVPARDYAFICLGFYSAVGNEREGWNSRTMQIGTHLMLLRLLKGEKSDVVRTSRNRTLHHMIDVGMASATVLGKLIAAEVNQDQNQTLETIQEQVNNNASVLDFGFLSQITAGDFLFWYITVFSRRFWLGAAICAGTQMLESNCQLFGAGSRFITKAHVDTTLAPRSMTEQLADLSSFISFDGTFHIPVPVIRGSLLTVDYSFTGGSDIAKLFGYQFPTIVPAPSVSSIYYPMHAPSSGGLPAIVPFSSADLFVYSFGEVIDVALNKVSSMLDVLQANIEIGTANANRDGPRSHVLGITHYMSDELNQDGYDISILNECIAELTVKPLDPRALDSLYCNFTSVMYGNNNLIPAFQVIYRRPNRIDVEEQYYQWRAGYIDQFGHKRAAMPFSGSNTDLHDYGDTVMSRGGNIISSIFGPGGLAHSGAKLLAKGVLDFLDGKEKNGNLSKAVRGKTENQILNMVESGELHPANLAPVEHGLISLDRYMDAAIKALSVKKEPIRKSRPLRSRKKRRKTKT